MINQYPPDVTPPWNRIKEALDSAFPGFEFEVVSSELRMDKNPRLTIEVGRRVEVEPRPTKSEKGYAAREADKCFGTSPRSDD